jgi:hypothetical protein
VDAKVTKIRLGGVGGERQGGGEEGGTEQFVHGVFSGCVLK